MHIDTRAAAAALGLTTDGLRTAARRAGITPQRVGRELRWTPAQLLALQTARRNADQTRRQKRARHSLTL